MVSSSVSLESNPYQGCQEVFVGGGWSGVYAFYRRVLHHPTLAHQACLMEASERIGGRTYSVDVDQTLPDEQKATLRTSNFTLDVGAYRFSPDMHLVGDLILHGLNLTTECYQPHCPSARDDFPEPFLFNYSAPLRRIVDPHTRLPIGYAAAMHQMVREAQHVYGARVFTNTKLVGLEKKKKQGNDASVPSDTNVTLTFRNTLSGQVHIVPNSVRVLVLNLPRNHLFQVEGLAESLEPSVKKTLRCIVFDTPEDMFGKEMVQEFASQKKYTTRFGKAYLYYQEAWWRTQLHQFNGQWPNTHSFGASLTPQGVRLNIRWHDGPVGLGCNRTRDDFETSPIEKESNNHTHPYHCDGWLEIYYSVSNETFYASFPPSRDEPLGVVWETDGPKAQQTLALAHEAVMISLAPLIQNTTTTTTTTTTNTANPFPQPTGLMVGIWQRPTLQEPLGYGYTAPSKVYYDPQLSGTPDRACGVPGLTDDVYRHTVLQPWGDSVHMFLVNNDYDCRNVRYFFGDWAEETVLQAERALHVLNMPPPAWLQNQSYYQDNVVEPVSVGTHLLLSQQTTKPTTVSHSLLQWPVVLAVVVLLISAGQFWKSYKTRKQQQAGYTSLA